MRAIKKFMLIFFGLFCPFFAHAESIIKQADNTTLELFSDGQNEHLLKFSINEGWHIYYSNPGEIGKPTYIENLNAENPLEITDKSVPKLVKAYDIMDEYLYENVAYFKLHSAQNNNLHMAVNFVECADICKPQRLVFELEKMPQSSPVEWQNILQAAEKTFPSKVTVTFEKSYNSITLDLPYSDDIKIIPSKREIVSGEEFSISGDENKTTVSWQNISEQNRLKSVLIISADKAIEADIDYDVFDWRYFIYIVVLAFFGGIVLNAMPCVFPILSLKLFGILKNHNHRRRWKNAVLYTAGVLCSFLGLAAILDVLKEGGKAIGWGFQLQSPIFVLLMMILFFVLFLYMIEALPFPTISNRKLYKLSSANMFLTGFFAVLIASPCSGPFMGAAIGYAFMQTDLEMYAVFLALALGYALPFVLAETHPQLLQKILPKPGAWMNKLKTILALPILLTCIWLSCVLVAQLYSHDGLNKNNLNWREYSADEVQQEIFAGKKVFIDFTAEWCLTCMFNEKTRLNSNKFANFVRDNKVELFKADLTESNEEYNDALSSYGRDGIPVYVYYENKTYRILPIFFDIDDINPALAE